MAVDLGVPLGAGTGGRQHEAGGLLPRVYHDQEIVIAHERAVLGAVAVAGSVEVDGDE